MRRLTWRPSIQHGRVRWWLTHRGLPATVALAVVALLLHLVFQPFRHPRVHLVFAEVKFPQLPGIPQVPLRGDRDSLSLPQAAFLGSPSKDAPDHQYQVASSADFEQLLARLDDGEIRRRDVLILWLGAQPVSGKDDVLLLCGDDDLDEPSIARFSMSALLDRIRDCPARTKLILFDNGRVLHAPRLGIFADGTAHRIQQLVRKTNDPALWVMLSHSELETSQRESAPPASAFACAVGDGLRGHADLDANRFIDLGEFFQYVRDHLASQAIERPDRISQTPVLVWGGGKLEPSPTYPLLAPVVPPESTDGQEAAGESGLASAVSNRVPSGTAPTVQVSRGAGLGSAPSVRVSRPTAPRAPSLPTTHTTPSLTSMEGALDSRTENQPSATGEHEAASEDPSSAEQAESQQPKAADGPHELKPEQATPKPEPLSDSALASAVDELSSMAWLRFDWIAASQNHLIDRAPHLWRALHRRLLLLDALYLQDSRPGIPTAMRRMVRQLDDMVNGQMPQQYGEHDLAVELARLLHTSDGDAPQWSLAQVEQMALWNSAPLPDELAPVAAGLDALLATGSRTEFDKWIAELPARFDRYVECRQARRFSLCPDLEWPEIRLALQACRWGEQTAAETLESGRWTRLTIERADQCRLAGERALLTGVRPQDRSRAVALLQQAVSAYDLATTGNSDVVATQRLVNEGLFYVPALFERSIGLLRSTDPAAPDPEKLSCLLHSLQQAIEVLDHPAPARLLELRRTRHQLEQAMKVVRASHSGPDILPRDETVSCQFDQLRRLAGLYSEWLRMLSGDQPQVSAVAEAASRLRDADNPDDFWETCGQLGDASRNFCEGAPAAIEQILAENRDLDASASVRDDRIRGLRKARRLLYVVQPWDVQRTARANPTPWLRLAQLYDLFAWQRQRLACALDDAPPWERPALLELASAFAHAANQIPEQPTVASLRGPLVQLEGVEYVNLIHTPETELILKLTSQHDRPVDVWLCSDHDLRLLAVQAVGGTPVYDWPLLTPMVAPSQSTSQPDSNLSAARRTLATLPPSVYLPAGQGKAISIRVRRTALATTDCRVVFRAVTAAENARHDLTVEVPRHAGVTLTAEGTPDTWQPSETGLVLCPYPNRTTSYTLSLGNTGPSAAEVDFEIIRTACKTPMLFPQGQVSAQVAAECLTRLDASESIVRLEEIALPGYGEPVAIPFAGPPDKTPEDQAEERETEQGQGKKQQKPQETPPELSRYLVAVITDCETQRKTLKSIEIVTQRPRRYVTPAVKYDPTQRRVEIRVQPVSPSAMPPDGVRVTCESVGVQGDSQYRRSAVLQPDAAETVLHLDVPVDTGAVFPIHIDVDGVERAFRYEVPTDSNWPVDVPESNRVDVRIMTPLPGSVLGPRPGEIDVVMEVDIPGGLREGTGVLEVGIDDDRDRELDGEEGLLLASDRQVELRLERIGEDGTLAIRTRVDDLRVTLPPPKLNDARVNLIARVSLPDREAWSDPVELILDGQPPGLNRLQLRPGPNVPQGTELDVSVFASDWDLSGVAKVEVGIDTSQRGEFAEEPPPLIALPLPDGRWAAKVPTEELKPGHYAVLVRATDRQGNQSNYLRSPVQVIPMDESTDDSLKLLSGRVVYGRFSKSPVASVPVRLINKEDETIAKAVSDAEGRFTLKAPPGEYQLRAEVLLGGNRRSAQASVTIPPEDAVAEKTELLLTTAQGQPESR
jgi:uncharacterized protein DUF1416